MVSTRPLTSKAYSLVSLDLLIIGISISWEFFPSVLADGLSLEFEWQQVASSLQNSSQYSDRSQ